MATHNFTPEILTAAIEGLESQKRRIDAQIIQVRQMLEGGRKESAATREPAKTQRVLSAAARKRISEAQKQRWAKSKSQSQRPLLPAAPEAPKQKRKLSAAGRKRIAEATKRRWAAFRAAAEKTQPAAEKKAASAKVAPTAVAVKAVAKKTVKKPQTKTAKVLNQVFAPPAAQ
jgi:hypothetical protein